MFPLFLLLSLFLPLFRVNCNSLSCYSNVSSTGSYQWSSSPVQRKQSQATFPAFNLLLHRRSVNWGLGSVWKSWVAGNLHWWGSQPGPWKLLVWIFTDLNLNSLLFMRTVLHYRKCQHVVYLSFKKHSKVCKFYLGQIQSEFSNEKMYHPLEKLPFIIIHIIIHISSCWNLFLL